MTIRLFTLDAETVTAYLKTRGLSSTSGPIRVIQLSGGVSGTILLVEHSTGRLVVKQALPQLKVASRWLADPGRAETEAAAIALLHPLSPDHTPELLDSDPDQHVLTISAAPSDWASWKDLLLSGPIDPGRWSAAAAQLGETLGHWHEATSSGGSLWPELQTKTFADPTAFEQLRVGPFHRRVQAIHPEVAPAVQDCIDELLAARQCLVHGDFSPKNVVIGSSGWWILDFEVAHLGAAVFDLAFLISHLLLKAAGRPAAATVYRVVAATFVTAYLAARPGLLVPPSLGRQIACLLLARIDGTSPVGYLDQPQQSRIRAAALQFLQDRSSDSDLLWTTLGVPA